MAERKMTREDLVKWLRLYAKRNTRNAVLIQLIARQIEQDGKEIAKWRALAHAFRNADEKDWQWLFNHLGHSGHGQFWKAVLKEAHAALTRSTGGTDG